MEHNSVSLSSGQEYSVDRPLSRCGTTTEQPRQTKMSSFFCTVRNTKYLRSSDGVQVCAREFGGGFDVGHEPESLIVSVSKGSEKEV